MPHISKNDLKFQYQWSAMPPDDPRLTGQPDATFLNRHEGYEVLAFLNKTSANPAGALKAERLIKERLPGDVRSRRNVLDWLIANWSKFP
jgi:hypothetical protein